MAMPSISVVCLSCSSSAESRGATEAMLPVSEITQFPSVLLALRGRESAIVDEFNTYVRPRLNPTLTQFSVQLTGITQEMVDASPILEDVLPKYLEWLQSHGLVSDSTGTRSGHWAFCTWSDILSAPESHNAVPCCNLRALQNITMQSTAQ